MAPQYKSRFKGEQAVLDPEAAGFASKTCAVSGGDDVTQRPYGRAHTPKRDGPWTR